MYVCIEVQGELIYFKEMAEGTREGVKNAASVPCLLEVEEDEKIFEFLALLLSYEGGNLCGEKRLLIG